MVRRSRVNLGSKNRPRVRQRKPTWRYDYVVELIDSYNKPRSKDDYYIKELFKLIDIIRNGTPMDVEDYSSVHPDIADSLTLYEQGVTHCTDIHCRVIAGYDYDEIANVVGVEPKVVELYVKCFFDIEDQRGNQGYMNRFVIQPITKIDPYSEEAMWVRLATVGGKEMLKRLETCRPDQARDFFETIFENLMLLKSIQAVGGLKPSSYSATDLISTMCNKIESRKRLEALEGHSVQEDSWMAQMASMVLKTFAFGMVTQDQNMLPADPLRSKQLTAEELEAHYEGNPPKLIENIPTVNGKTGSDAK